MNCESRVQQECNKSPERPAPGAKLLNNQITLTGTRKRYPKLRHAPISLQVSPTRNDRERHFSYRFGDLPNRQPRLTGQISPGIVKSTALDFGLLSFAAVSDGTVVA